MSEVAPPSRTVPPQIIPRPAAARAGPPPPWAELAAPARAGLSLGRVGERLRGRLHATVPGRRESAVLAALFEEAGESRILLTRRAATLRSHRSEVSFPGGRLDEGESVVAAALREAWEEIGLDPASVEPIGMLGAMTTVSSNTLVHPVVGLLPGRPPLRPNPAEVELAFDVALADLLAPGVYHSEAWTFAGGPHTMHFFELPADIVWGATGRMVFELLGRVTATLGPGDLPSAEAAAEP